MRWLGIAVAIALAGCTVTAPYPCTTHDQCTRGGTLGYCEAAGFCSFDDTTCATQRRYDTSADALAGTCVEGIVTGRFRQRYVTNDEQFAPVVAERGAPAALAAPSVTLLDGTTQDVSYRAADGAFSFPDPAGLGYDLVIGGTTYQLSQLHLELVVLDAGRPAPDRGMVTMSPMLRFQYTNNPGNSTTISSTGLWTQTPAGGSTAFQFNWKSAVPLTGTLGLLDASQHDLVYLTKFAPQNGYSAIVGVGTASVTLTDTNATVAIPAATLDLPLLDQCVHVVVPEMDAVMRIAAALPQSYSNAAEWVVEAAPAPLALGRVGALEVVNATPTAIANVDRTVTLHDPFVGTELLASLEVRSTYSITLSGATSGMSAINAQQITAPFAHTGGCATDVSSLTPTAGIAGPLVVGGTAVTSDEQHVTIDRMHPVTITWTLASAGSVDVHGVELYELTNDAGVTHSTLVTAAVTTAPSFAVDPKRLVKDHIYVLRIAERVGTPNASDGDLATIALPQQSAISWTNSFVPQ